MVIDTAPAVTGTQLGYARVNGYLALPDQGVQQFPDVQGVPASGP